MAFNKTLINCKLTKWDKIKKSIFSNLPPDSLRRRLAFGTLWAFIGILISRGLNLIAFIIIARFIGTVSFGELGIIQSTIGMMSILAYYGPGITATKYVAEFRERDKKKTGNIINISLSMAIISGGILSIIFFFISSWLAYNTLAAPHLTIYLRISAGILFFETINGTLNGTLAGFEAFKTIAYINVLVGIFSFPLLITGIIFGRLEGVLIALVLTSGLSCLINKSAINKKCIYYRIPLKIKKNYKDLSFLLNFSLPAFLSNSILGPASWICNVMLANQSNGYSELGIFNAANQWKNALSFIPVIISRTVVPIVSNIIYEKSIYKIKRLFYANIYINGGFLFPVIVLIFFLNSSIMRMYGKNFENGGIVLSLMVLVSFLRGLQIPANSLIISFGKMWVVLIMNTGWSLALVFFSWHLIKHGSIGLAVSYIIAYTILVIWGFIYCRNLMIFESNNKVHIESQLHI